MHWTLRFACPLGCGLHYCSRECLGAACLGPRAVHYWLCTGPIPESEDAANHPVLRFKMHALEFNDTFLLAAQLALQAVSLDLFESPVWWERPNADGGSAGQAGVPVEELHSMRMLASESLDLLKEALSCRASELPELAESDVSGSLTLERWGRYIGLLERNQVQVRVPHPLAQAARKGREQADLLMGLAKALDDPPRDVQELVEHADEFFPPSCGAALFRNVALCNHACEPLAMIDFVDCARARLVALRDIAEGQDITICYVPARGGAPNDHSVVWATERSLRVAHGHDHGHEHGHGHGHSHGGSAGADETLLESDESADEQGHDGDAEATMMDSSDDDDDEEEEEEEDVSGGEMLGTPRREFLADYGISCSCAKCMHQSPPQSFSM